MQLPTQAIVKRPCPVCGGGSDAPFAEERLEPGKNSAFTYASRKLPEFMCLRLVRCVDCDLVYAPTPPSTDFLRKAYTAAAYDSGDEAQAAARSYAKVLTPYVGRLAGRSAAVDVGAGSGALLPWLKESGFNPVIGIEPSRAAIEAAPAAIRPMLREGIFSPALLTDVRLSLICSFMTLEHITNPGVFSGAAYEMLEPGGMLAVIVHNWRSLVNRLLGLRSPIIDVQHLQLFCPKAISTLLANAGFVSIDLIPIANAYSLRYWLRLTPLSAGVKNKISGILDRFRLLGSRVSLRVGNMLAVGIKP